MAWGPLGRQELERLRGAELPGWTAGLLAGASASEPAFVFASRGFGGSLPVLVHKLDSVHPCTCGSD